MNYENIIEDSTINHYKYDLVCNLPILSILSSHFVLTSPCVCRGELIMWDLTRGGKQKRSLLGASSEGQNHIRIVFNMSSVCVQDNKELLLSTSMDREVRWGLNPLDVALASNLLTVF